MKGKKVASLFMSAMLFLTSFTEVTGALSADNDSKYVVSKNEVLSVDKTVDNMYIEGGSLDMNGKTLTVKGDLILSEGTLTLNGGKIYVGGDFRQQTEKISSDGKKVYTEASGSAVKMTKASDFISVDGSFFSQEYYSATHNDFSDGIIEVKGDFRYIACGYNNNFLPTGKNRVVFSGDKLQKVSLDGCTSGFAALELKNYSPEGVFFETTFLSDSFVTNGCVYSFADGGVFGSTLKDDMTITGSMTLSAGKMNLNGHKLTINGDLMQSGGEMNINGGELVVSGDYAIRKVDGEIGAGALNMTNDADTVDVSGAFVMQSEISHIGKLTAGKLKVGEDFIVADGNASEFYASGTHMVILYGSKPQRVNFSNSLADGSHFNSLKIENTSAEGITFASKAFVCGILYNTESAIANSEKIILDCTLYDGKWNHSLSTESNVTLKKDIEIDGNLYLNNYSLSLDRNTLVVGANLIIGGGDLYVNSGNLIVKKDLREQKENINADGTVSYSAANDAFLVMTDENGSAEVYGDYYANNNSSGKGELTAGTLKIGGNLTQIGQQDNFRATGTHKTIFNGANTQKVSFDSTMSGFAEVVLENSSAEGVTFNRFNCLKLTTNGNKYTVEDGSRLGYTLEKDEVLDGDFVLSGGTLDLNGHRLEINGSFIHAGGTVFVNGGEFFVTNDYKMQSANGADSSGILKMINPDDKVKIGGSFVMQSKTSHSGMLTDGIMEIGGDLAYSDYCSKFVPTGRHSVVLGGNGKQTITTNNGYGTICFNNLDFANKSEEGASIGADTKVSGILGGNGNIENSCRIKLDTSASLKNNKWFGDISVGSTYKLNADTEISGSLYLSYLDIFDVNEKTLNIGKDLVVNGGRLNLNKGRINVSGDFRHQNMTERNGKFVYEVGNYGEVNMLFPEDYLFVGGDFISYDRQNKSLSLIDGTIEIKGNFMQFGDAYKCFYATENNKVIFSGDKKQSISAECPQMRFARIELKNTSDDGVVFENGINYGTLEANDSKYSFADGSRRGWTLEKDEETEGDLLISGGKLDLNGHKLTVNGNITITAGEMAVNGGKLDVSGNLSVKNVGILSMTNEKDNVNVSGNFVMESTASHSGKLTAGVLEIGGDFSRNGRDAYDNFAASGTHKIIFNGSKAQKISFGDMYAALSYFNDLEIRNTNGGVDFIDAAFVSGRLYRTDSSVINGKKLSLTDGAAFADGKWDGDIAVCGKISLVSDTEIGGTLYLSNNRSNNDGIVDVRGKTLSVKKNIVIEAGKIIVNGGNVHVYGDIHLQAENADGSYSKAYRAGNLEMALPEDYVVIDGSYYAENQNETAMTGGTLEIKGDFTQKNVINGYNTYNKNFCAEDEQTVIFSGNKKQTVSIESIKAKFANIELKNTSADGVCFNVLHCDKLNSNGNKYTVEDGSRLGYTLEKDEVLDGDFVLSGGTLDLNGHRLEINGSFIHAGGTVFVNGGEFFVTNDYKMQSANGADSSGILKMINPDDKVKIGGSFVMQSKVPHNGVLTDGIMEVGKDYTLMIGYSEENIFVPEKNHTVVLLSESGYSDIKTSKNDRRIVFANLKINCNARFMTDCMVNGTLSDTDNEILYGRRLTLGKNAVIDGNRWNGDIRVSSDKVLENDTEIKGTLYIDGGVFALNSHILTTGGSLVISEGTLDIGDGKAYIGGNLRQQRAQFTDSEAVTYSNAIRSRLIMDNAEGYLLVGSGFYAGEYYGNYSSLTDGVLEIRGDFVQTGNNDNFSPNNNHKTILSGAKVQNITFSNSASGFNILEITKTLENGYNFSHTPAWNELIVREKDTEAPSAPTGLNAERVRSSAVDLIWDAAKDNVGVEGYCVYRNGKLAGTAKTARFTDTGLDNEAVYVYEVTAFDIEKNVSNSSEKLEISTLADSGAPTKPLNLTAEKGSGLSVILGWSASADDNYVAGYNIYRNGTMIAIAETNGFTDILTAEGEYAYSIQAKDNAGNLSKMSDEVLIRVELDEQKPEIIGVSPESGKTIMTSQQIGVIAKDNALLKEIIVESRNNGGEWKEAYRAGLDGSEKAVKFVLDTSGFETGTVEVRIKAVDASGNESAFTEMNYLFKKSTLTVPKLFADGKGWRTELSWTTDGNSDIAGFYVYRKNSDGGFVKIAAVKGLEYTDTKVKSDTEYIYCVEAVDERNNSVLSAEVSAVPTNDDDVPPVADAGCDLRAVAGKSVSFDGSLSYDNHGIASYLWNFGDGKTGTGMRAAHIYSGEGSYTVKLTVRDSTGNSDVHEINVTVYGNEYMCIPIKVIDESGAALSSVRVFFDAVGEKTAQTGTDSEGNYVLAVPKGVYEIYFLKNGYLPQQITISEKDSVKGAVVKLKKDEIITGKFTVKQLNLEEITALGIDIHAPENRFVYKYSTTLVYHSESRDIEIYTNESGDIIKSSTIVLFDEDEYTRYVIARPLTTVFDENYTGTPSMAILSVSISNSWLKEFYDAELTIINNAEKDSDFVIENASAVLELPDGLSLADTFRDDSIVKNLGDIKGGEQKTASWIIKGDKAGEYFLSADFSGVLMPFCEPMNASFKTEKPIKIDGAEALELEVVHDLWGITDDYWNMTYKLTNVSDKTLYDVETSISGYTQFTNVTNMLMKFPNGDIVILPWKDSKPVKEEEKRYVDAFGGVPEATELKPGESIIIVISFEKTI